MTTTMKKTYISPVAEWLQGDTESFMALSSLDPSSDTPSVSVTNEEYDGEFSSRLGGSMWDEE